MWRRQPVARRSRTLQTDLDARRVHRRRAVGGRSRAPGVDARAGSRADAHPGRGPAPAGPAARCPRSDALRPGLGARSSRAVVPWYLRERGTPRSRAGISRRLRRQFEALGSTYVKLGQIISAFEGLFPDELVDEFKKLRDQVPPERFADVRAVVEAELGRPLETVFAEFAEEPLAAASIAQVHAARLLTGEEVVVKVQRPKVAAARALRPAGAVVARSAAHRSHPDRRARQPARARRAVRGADRRGARLPARGREHARPRRASSRPPNSARWWCRVRTRIWVTERVLVMERLRGFAFDDVESMHDAGPRHRRDPARPGLIACLEGALIHGVFHGDLHGGNLLVQPSGRTVLFDFGITGRLGDVAAARVPATADHGHRRRRARPARRRCATSARSRPTPTSTRCTPTSSSTSR